ncbi:probable E3 ubiquitin ligase complex SCF subunit sconB [Lotus japonicus]|uniref:probable E3 ubiquitin ligase complex SCF subunit sconB n=1 Tax=Lotus japonicus TaxID=34305 RepID=UPI0025850E00|nr:probable E3 ubiquitin ligase complex SCF subunit sconB [Lotus japonicus]
MAGTSPPPSPSQSQSPATPAATTVTDLNDDTLGHCASFLNPRDVCSLAMTSTVLKRVAYSDFIWQRFFTERWHQEIPRASSSSSQQHRSRRELYVARYTDSQQFKFFDPLGLDVLLEPKRFTQLLLHENHAYSAQGSVVEMVNLDAYQEELGLAIRTLSDHRARITCMRLFSHDDMSLCRGETQGEQNVLVTSSCDHSIRLWWKGSCLRCLRGHNGPVLSLSNELLGEGSSKVLASGGEDSTVRLWSLGSSGERGKHALKATLYGHVKPVNFLSVAGHKTSLLVSMSRDSKVRVWDTATSSSSCVGTSFSGAPVNMKCHESLLYVAAGSSVTAVDLRTMHKVITIAVHPSKLYSFDAFPSKYLICTGSDDRAMLWDIRRNQEPVKPELISELGGHRGPVTCLHMDPYKIITGGRIDECVNVWEVDTGVKIRPLLCFSGSKDMGCDAMAVDGCRIITASYCRNLGILRFRDFNNATKPYPRTEDK